jgi:lipopolysaccharide export system permease protein
MKLDFYVLRRFLSIFLMAMVAVLVIFVAVDYIGALRLWNDKTPDEVRRYYLFATPYIIFLSSPIALLLATLFTFAGFARRLELMAMLAAGRPFWRIALPVWLAGIAYTGLWIKLQEDVMPRYNHERLKIRQPKKSVFKANATRTDFAYMAGKNEPMFFRTYSSQTREGWDVTYSRQFRDGLLAERIDASHVRWDDKGAWVFKRAKVRSFDSLGNMVKYAVKDSLVLPLGGARPEDLISTKVQPEEMTLVELGERVQSLRRAGEETHAYEAEMVFKRTSPWINAIVVLIGSALAALLGRRGQALAFGLGIFLAFAFYASARLGLALGHSGAISAFWAGWAPNLVFLVIGMGLLWRASRN